MAGALQENDFIQEEAGALTVIHVRGGPSKFVMVSAALVTAFQSLGSFNSELRTETSVEINALLLTYKHIIYSL